MRGVFSAVAMLACLALCGVLRAGDCVDCGRSCGHKYCKLVCEMKKVTDVEFDVKCEDFCVPGPSKKCGCKWIPSCGCVRTKRVLVKHEVTKEVPTWKCVVVYRCPHCMAAAQNDEQVESLADADESIRSEATVSDVSPSREVQQTQYRR